MRKKKKDDTREREVTGERVCETAAWVPESPLPLPDTDGCAEAGQEETGADVEKENEQDGGTEDTASPEFPPVFVAMASAFARGRGMPAEELDSAMTELRRIGEGWKNGTPDVGMLETVIKGLDYDRAVAAASMEGEIRGRNAGIEETYMRPEESDGLPHLSGGGTARSGKRVASIFDLARNA